MSIRTVSIAPLFVPLVFSWITGCVAANQDCASIDPFCNPGAAALLLGPGSADREIDWIYWADSNNQKIQRIRPDATDLTNLVDTTGITILVLDASGSRLYWSESGSSRLARTNLIGGDLVYMNLTGTPVGLAVDSLSGFVYVSNSGTDQIERYDLNGNNLTVLASGLNQPRDLDLDVAGQRLYWTDDTDNALYSMSTGGGAITTVLTGLNTGAGTRFEPAEGRVYLTEASAPNRYLRIDPDDPSAFETLFTGATRVGVADPDRNRHFISEPAANIVYLTDWSLTLGTTFLDLTSQSVIPTSLHLLYR